MYPVVQLNIYLDFVYGATIAKYPPHLVEFFTSKISYEYKNITLKRISRQ